MSRPVVFEDIFEVLEKDPDGRRFDKVSRYRARSDLYEMDLLLDINIELFPLVAGDKLSLALASTLKLDGSAETGEYDPDLVSGAKLSLMDKYEYVMHGKVFKFKENMSSGQLRVEIYISFGGLLMQLVGDPKKLSELEVDSAIYLLLRKVN